MQDKSVCNFKLSIKIMNSNHENRNQGSELEFEVELEKSQLFCHTRKNIFFWTRTWAWWKLFEFDFIKMKVKDWKIFGQKYFLLTVPSKLFMLRRPKKTTCMQKESNYCNPKVDQVLLLAHSWIRKTQYFCRTWTKKNWIKELKLELGLVKIKISCTCNWRCCEGKNPNEQKPVIHGCFSLLSIKKWLSDCINSLHPNEEQMINWRCVAKQVQKRTKKCLHWVSSGQLGRVEFLDS